MSCYPGEANTCKGEILHFINLQSLVSQKSKVHWIKSKLKISAFSYLKMGHITDVMHHIKCHLMNHAM